MELGKVRFESDASFATQSSKSKATRSVIAAYQLVAAAARAEGSAGTAAPPAPPASLAVHRGGFRDWAASGRCGLVLRVKV
eukprot:364901-Chlamydomonas_euryale.AAC.9